MMTALEMYADDAQHASPAGSDFAAKYIWETIRMDMGAASLPSKAARSESR